MRGSIGGIFTVVGSILFFVVALFAHAATDSLGVELEVSLCDADGICEAGENATACPLDCEAPPEPPPPPQETTSPTPRTRGVLIANLFLKYLPFAQPIIGRFDAPVPTSNATQCVGDVCTVFVDTLRRSVVLSFEQSRTGGEALVLNVIPTETSVRFEWQTGITLRIMYSDREFPIDAMSGDLLYEGNGGVFLAPLPATTVGYYGLFPQESDGSYGKPEFVLAQRQGEGDGERPLWKRWLGAAGLTALLLIVGRFILLLL